MAELSQVGGTAEDVFATFDAAAEAATCTGLLMIDALNESDRPERWREYTRALLVTADRYPHVAVVLSCRSEFVEAVIGDEHLPLVEHVGFAEATGAAVERFTREYGLEAPTFPPLSPEFGNPLFLKLTCEALEALGATRFPLGSAGLVTVCSAFLEAANRRLAEPGRCDSDDQTDPVSVAVRGLALLGAQVLERPDVKRVTDEALPGRAWSRSLMRGLISEGILAEMGDGRIAFGYQRLGDVIRAGAIAEGSSDDVETWLRELGDDVWRERGVLGALAVTLPESHGVELIELAVDDEGRVQLEFVDGFLESLLLRSPASVSARTAEIVQRLLDDDYRVDDIWERLVRIAYVPGHLLNAEWLHARLAMRGVADRDSSWSNWLVGAMDVDEETAVRRLIEWAWPRNLGDRRTVPDDVAVLVAQTFAWLLTTSDRRVRDRATKALVSVGERAPAALAEVLTRFRGTDDPYVVERLAAAACGVALRVEDPDALGRIADGLSALVADGWPEHILTRDFVRRAFGASRARGWSGSDGLPPYGAAWPVPTRPLTEIDALAGPPDYAYASIWHSLKGMGDFGRYVLQSSLRDVVTEDEQALLRDAERAVFERVLALGWTPDRFAQIDQGRIGRGGVVERVGKKYQWIGFYEVLGRIADNHPIRLAWGDASERPYEYAEQLVWRDIDPTVLVRKPASPAPEQIPWFTPVEARFPSGTVDEYPGDMVGVPDPVDLIFVSDMSGASWLVLRSDLDWEQPLPPEIEALGAPRLAVWMQLHAYLVAVADVADLRVWADGKDWFGRWMPETPDLHNLLLGAHPNDPSWWLADGRVGWWETHAGGPQPCELFECGAWYGGTGTSRDASAEEETRGFAPSRRLFDLLGLSKGVDFVWRDATGIAVQDPAVVAGGPGSLVMRRDLGKRLADAGVTIFWTVLVGKELHRSYLSPPDDDLRWVSASASYLLDSNGIDQLGARAIRCAPGPTTERVLDWAIKGSLVLPII
jgi:hypothetical protein